MKSSAPETPTASTTALHRGIAMVATALALATACAAEDELDAEADDPLAETEMERDGVVYDRIGPVLEEPVEPGPEAVVRPLTEMIEEAEDARPLDTWSREELAQSLRPVIASADGSLYMSRELAWEAADAVLEGGTESFSVDLVEREGRPAVEAVDDETFRTIIGADGRTRVANTAVAPHNRIVKMRLYSGNTYRGHCTGSYIGPWTLVTAGHCLVFSNTDRINRIVFEPARNGGVLPYGSYDCRLDDASGTNDYLWSVPAGYYSGQANELDYAVIDTWPCHGAPTWFGGYEVNAASSVFSTHGYPADTCPGAPGPSNYQCGMNGSAYVNEWRMETQFIDTMGGQSGMPWYRTYDIPRVIGNHVGYRSYFDLFQCGFAPCVRNYARRIDAAYDTFIKAVSYDY